MTIGNSTFETERLLLDPLCESHAAELFNVYSDPRMYTFIPQDPPASLEALAARYRFLEARRSPDGTEQWLNWAVRLKSTRACIGCIQITLTPDGRAQLAYEIGVPYWQQGYATEACARVIEALFALRVVEVWAELDTRNTASIRLLERLGLQRGALKRDADFFKGATSDEWIYTVRRDNHEEPSMPDTEQWPPELDAVVAAPNHHTILLENDRVRVLDTRIEPGDKTPVHTHRWPSVYYIISFTDFVRRDAAGIVLVDTRQRPKDPMPKSVWSEPLPPHSLENVGDVAIHVVSVEIKGG